MAKKLTNRMLQAMHLKMVRIRRFEEEAGRLMEDGKIPGALHLYVGQEAVASGVMQHLADDDYITSTHRGHGHLIAKGGDFSKMFAELFGKATGYCKGKGGSMHISNMALGMLGANGIVGGGPPIAMGAAFSNRFRRTKQVSVAFLEMGRATKAAFMKPPIWQRFTNSPACLFAKTTVTESTLLRRIIRRLSTSPTAQRVTACPVWWSMEWT